MNKTKEKILTGAQAMFINNSFDGTALDTLLYSVNASKGSFFHHFKSKNDFLLQLIDFEAKALFGKLDEITSSSTNPLTAINNFLDWRLENYQETGRLIYKLGIEVGNKVQLVQDRIKKVYGGYLSILIKLIELGKINNQLVPATPSKELANFILYGLEGGTISTTLIENKDQYKDVVEMIKRVIRSYRNIDFSNVE